MMCEIWQNDSSNLPYLNILFHFICFRIFISVVSIKITSESTQSERLPCPVHRWFPKGMFLHERVELHFELNVMLLGSSIDR